MKYIKLFEQFNEFNEFDPFGEESSPDKNQRYSFGGAFYVLVDKLPEDLFIKYMLEKKHERIEFDFDIVRVEIARVDEYAIITINGNLEIERRLIPLFERTLREDLKLYITQLMKRITQYDDLDLEDFGLGVERI